MTNMFFACDNIKSAFKKTKGPENESFAHTSYAPLARQVEKILFELMV
jgi:hypothetical protein